MARSTTVYSVALCSPGGLESGRLAVRDAVAEVNRFLAADGKAVEIKAWEVDVRPTIGADAQDVVNKQIILDADIGIVLISDFLGSPTARAPSGTVEEVRSFIGRRKAGEAVDLMIFFKRVLLSYDREFLERMRAIVEFREELGKEGVFWKEFETDKELAELVRLHLPIAVRDLVPLEGVGSSTTSPVIYQGSALPIVEDDEGDIGAIDNEIVFLESMAAITDANIAMGEAAERMRVALDSGTNRLNEMPKHAERDPRALKSVIDEMSVSMSLYADDLEAGVGVISNNADAAIQAIVTMIGFSGSEVMASSDELFSLAETIDSTQMSMVELAAAAGGSLASIESMPRMTKKLNVAKRNVIQRTGEVRDVISSFSQRLGEAAVVARERANQLR